MAIGQRLARAGTPGTDPGWGAPVRRLLGRLLTGTPPPGSPAGTRTGGAPWIVDCAGYVDGHRLPGRYGYAEALARVRRRRGFVWLGLREPTGEQFADVARVFGLDAWTAEHAVAATHRPAVERSGDVTVFLLRTTGYVEHSELTETSEVVETGAVVVFVGPHFVLTVRHGAPGALGAARAELQRQPEVLSRGPWAVAHAVCDRLVGSYEQVATAVGVDVDALEEEVFSRRGNGQIAHIYQLKRELVEFRRAVAPLQRPLAELIEDAQVPEEVRRYFRDVGNTLARTVDQVTSYDDLLNSIMQARLAQVTVDQNNDMRKIAAWAAIATLQTSIAGIYGMNFDFMPELTWRYGYFAVLGLMAASGVAAWRGFRRNRWL